MRQLRGKKRGGKKRQKCSQGREKRTWDVLDIKKLETMKHFNKVLKLFQVFFNPMARVLL